MNQPPGWADKSLFYSEKSADKSSFPKGFTPITDEEVNTHIKERLDVLDKMVNGKNSSSGGKSILILLGSILLVILVAGHGIIAYGYCSKMLWQWFMVPIWDVKPITWLQAYGLYVLVRLFTSDNPFQGTDSLKNLTKPEKIGRIIGSMIIPWVALLTGYIVKCYM
jgi:hypothetical protein